MSREAKLQQQADELEKQIAVANDRLRELEELREQLALERAAFEGQAARLQERERGIAAREQELDQKLNELAACRSELEQASLSHPQSEQVQVTKTSRSRRLARLHRQRASRPM